MWVFFSSFKYMMEIKDKFVKFCLLFFLLISNAYSNEASLMINPIGIGFGVLNVKIEKFLEDKPSSFLVGMAFGKFGFSENFKGDFLGISFGYRRYLEDKRVNTLFAEMGMNTLFINGVIRDTYGYYDYYVSGFAILPSFSAGLRVGGKVFLEGSLGFGFMFSTISVGSYNVSIGGFFPLFNINVGVMF